MKQILLLPIFITSFLASGFAQARVAPINITGEVIAYIEPRLVAPPHSYIPNTDVLIVRIKSSKRAESKYIKVITQYFAENSPLPQNILSRTGKWKFTLARRVDCDSVLNPDYSELFNRFKAANDKNGEVWAMDEPPKVHFINPKVARNISTDQVLPCYLIVGLREK